MLHSRQHGWETVTCGYRESSVRIRRNSPTLPLGKLQSLSHLLAVDRRYATFAGLQAQTTAMIDRAHPIASPCLTIHDCCAQTLARALLAATSKETLLAEEFQTVSPAMLGGDECKRPDGVAGPDPPNRWGGTKLCADCSDETQDSVSSWASSTVKARRFSARNRWSITRCTS